MRRNVTSRVRTTTPKVCIVQYNSSRFLARVDRSARTLAEAGCEVVLIAIKDAETPAFEQRDGYVVKRVELASRRWPRWTRPARFVEAVWRTYRAARAEDADVYNARDIYPLFVTWAAARRARAAFVYDSDELNLYRNWPWAKTWWWKVFAKAYEGFFIRRTSLNITSDEGRADILVREYGIKRPVVVLNVPDVTDRPRPDAAWREQATKGQEHLLLYTGGLVANRGLLELVDALEQLPGFALAFVGPGHLSDAIAARIVERGLSGRAEVYAPVPFERLMPITASADAMLIPIVGSCLSYRYAAPNKLFESMIAGVPVVAADLPDMAAIVRAESVGTLIADPTDPSSTAAAVRELFYGDEPLADIGERARASALRRYNWECERPRFAEAWGAVVLGDGRRLDQVWQAQSSEGCAVPAGGEHS